MGRIKHSKSKTKLPSTIKYPLIAIISISERNGGEKEGEREAGREGGREGGGGRKDTGESFSLVLESAGQDGTVEHHDGKRLERNPCDLFSVSLQVAMVTYQTMTLYGSFRIHVLIPLLKEDIKSVH